MTRDVFAIIVNWNGSEDVLTCVQQIRKSGCLPERIVVVDNGSAPEDVARLQASSDGFQVELLGKNQGFGAGANRGIEIARAADAGFVWLVNPDATVGPDALRSMLAVMSARPEVAAVGSVFRHADEEESAQVWGGGRVDLWTGRTWLLKGVAPVGQPDYLSGASLLLRMGALEDVGSFDEGYFMYWEDTDLSFRLRRAGYQLAVAPEAVVVHQESRSTGGPRNARAYAMYVRSAVRFFREHSRVPAIPIALRTAAGLLKWAVRGDIVRLRGLLHAATAPVDARQDPSHIDRAPPHVCISIPVYNGEQYILSAIRSALEQDYSNISVKVVDNASTDRTRELVSSVPDPRVQLVACDDFVPVGASWARALDHADGDYCLLLACDDMLLPGAIKTLVEAAEANAESAAVFGQARFTYDRAGRGSLGRPSVAPRPGHVGNLERYVLKNGFNMWIGGILFRRGVPGLRIEGASRNACDLDVVLRVGHHGGSGYVVPEEVVVVREHADALSSNRKVMVETTMDALAAHGTLSDAKRLYRSRAGKVLLWSVIDFLERDEPEAAIEMFQKYGDDLAVHWRLLVAGVMNIPGLRRALLSVRGARVTIRASPAPQA